VADPIRISVRGLLSEWNASARGFLVNQRIDADLANHGLVTSPNFRAVTLETLVELVIPGDSGNATEPGTVEMDAETRDIGLTIGNLPAALNGVLSIQPNATFEDAITQMLLNDYSQLPVLSGTHTVRGAVTWRSIAKARHAKSAATLADAIVPCEEVSYDRDLIDVLPILEEHDFVVVRDQKNRVAGIVTTADIAHAYSELASPFLLIGEIDQMLRRTLSRIYPLEDVVRWCDPDGSRGLSSFEDLDMGDYQYILENPDRWRSLEWPLGRTAFIRRLAELREIRNDVMHFNQDAIPPDGISKLRNMLNMLREFEI
jgi:CBS domain-containing protein